MIIRQLNLAERKGYYYTSGEEEKFWSAGIGWTSTGNGTLYRSLVMRAQFLALDRADLSEAVKSLTRKMKAPNESDIKDLKRLGRYLVGRPRVVNVYRPQRPTNVIKVQADSHHAGCLLTRRSTTGYTISIGTHCVKHGSNLQSTIALSSGESEFYALTCGAALGLKSEIADGRLGSAKRPNRAERFISSERYCCKARSRQATSRTNPIPLGTRTRGEQWPDRKSVNTKQNLADLCTKPVSREACEKHMRTLCQEFREGKASGAKALESTKV